MVDARSVTIVIPTFNRAHMLRRAIDTALLQKPECEVIVVDHGSADETPEVVASYGKEVVYLRRSRNNGPFYAWLEGVVQATNEYIHITYDDDWLDPTFVEKCLSLFTDESAFVFCQAQHVQNGVHGNILYKNMFPSGLHPAKLIENYLLATDLTISPGCAIFRKSDAVNALMAAGNPLAKSYYHGAGADLLMFLLPLLRYRKFGFVNEELAYFSVHPGSITSDACTDAEKYQALKDGYTEVKKFYLLLKYAEKTRLGEKLWKQIGKSPGLMAKMVKRLNLWTNN